MASNSSSLSSSHIMSMEVVIFVYVLDLCFKEFRVLGVSKVRATGVDKGSKRLDGDSVPSNS